MHIIGRGRYARETYPEANRAVSAFQNRLIASTHLLPGFTPATNPSASLIGAALVVPQASGVFMLLAEVTAFGPSADDTVGLIAVPGTGPGLSVTGGNVTVNGWVFGTTVPPVVGGVVTPNDVISVNDLSISAGKTGTLVAVGATDAPLPRGVASVIQLVLAEVVGGHSIANLAMSATLIELP